MKKKIGELYNKPIVIGNKNEVTRNEVHIDELSNVPTSGEGGGRPKRVYVTKETFQEALLQLEGTEQGGFGLFIMLYVDIIKYSISKPAIVGAAMYSIFEEQITAMGINLEMETGGNDSFLKFEEALQSLSQSAKSTFEAMPKITEEEFYNLDNGWGGK